MRKFPTVAAQLVATWLCFGLVSTAIAQVDADPRSRARTLCSQAAEARAAHDSARAEKLLEQALRLSPVPEISLQLGQLAEQEGRAVAAADHYRRYLDAMGESLDEASRVRIVSAQQALREPTAEVDILGPSGSLLFVDDHLVGLLPLASPMMLSAQSHRFRIVVKQSRFESDPLEITPSMRAQLHLTPGTSGTAVAILSLSSEWLVLIEPTELPPTQRALVEQSVATLAKRERASILSAQRLSRAIGQKPAGCLTDPICQQSVATELGSRAVVRIKLDAVAGKLHAEWFDVDGGGVAAHRERSCGTCKDAQLQQSAAALGNELLREAQNHPRGVLEVSSQPAGAQVVIDGQSRGVTPYQRALLVGRHDMKLRLGGHADYDQALDIQSGKSLTIEATLSPVASTAGSADRDSAMVQTPKRPLWRYLLGGGLIASGAIVSGLGISALSQSGSCGDITAPPGGAPCNYLYDTRAVGGGLVGVGIGLTVGGILTIAWPMKSTPVRTGSPALR